MTYRVARAKAGDATAMAELVEEHLTVVYRLVAAKLGRHDPAVEDVVQETLIAATTGIRGFRGGDEAAFVRWVLMVARHKVADHYRRRYARAEGALGEDGSDGHEVASVEEIAIGRERDVRVREALGSLTSDQEEIVTLKYILGYDNEHVAAITQRTIGAVKSMQHRALARLAELLSAERVE